MPISLPLPLPLYLPGDSEERVFAASAEAAAVDGRLDVRLLGHKLEAFLQTAEAAVHAAEDDAGHGVALQTLAVLLDVQRHPPGELHQRDDQTAERCDGDIRHRTIKSTTSHGGKQSGG